jgi:hypothetical protein
MRTAALALRGEVDARAASPEHHREHVLGHVAVVEHRDVACSMRAEADFAQACRHYRPGELLGMVLDVQRQ